jgi:hypothetical protein
MVTRVPARGPETISASGLVPEDERCGTARVVAVIGVHVRAADADGLDPHQNLAGRLFRLGLVTKGERVRAGIDESLHGREPYFAVKPPSTARVWPVM